jgi:predicted TIM-barrel fold metal-dependent hydrolase
LSSPHPPAPAAAKAKPERADSRLVDVHAHFLPDCYREALAAAGLQTLDGGIPIPQWSEDLALKAMDELFIETAMISLSSPSVRFVEGEAERDLCRKVNLIGADLAARRPDRFGFFATLPFTDEDSALAEAAFALDELETDGVIIETNIRGVYLGDQRLAPLFEELNRRAAVVFLHPTSPACMAAIGLGRPAPMIEFPMDTTRTVVDMIYAGTLKRCPDMKLIVSHGGGALPVLAARFAVDRPYVPQRPKDEAEVFDTLASLYYDVVQSCHEAPLAALRKIAPVDRLLFGSDMPFTKINGVTRNLERLHASDFSDADLRRIGRENAHRLFPRLQLACGCEP